MARLQVESLESRHLPAAGSFNVAAAFTYSLERSIGFVGAAYDTYLWRPVDPVGLTGWTNFLQQGGSEEAFEALLLSSDEYFALQGGTDFDWVTGLYLDLLGRAPAAAEVAYWLRTLDRGADPTDLAFAIASSAERQARVLTDYHVAYLGRLPDRTELQHWLAVLDQGFTRQDILASLLSDREYFEGVGDSNVDWIVAVYEDLLGRFPSSIEVGSWFDYLAGLTYAAAAPIVASTEAYVYLVSANYGHYLGRAPDPAGLAFFVSFLQQGGTEEQLQALLTSSAEYVALCGGTDVAWLEGLYQDVLDRLPSDVELWYWLVRLDAGFSLFDVAYQVTASWEAAELTVYSYYFTYLNRAPQLEEVDHWLDALAEGGTRQEIVAGLISSPEYYAAEAFNNEDWVVAVYRDVLFRTPAAVEINYWVSVIG